MKIGFVNFTPLNYSVETPYEEPLGGSESSLCYLAEALSKRGDEVILFGRYSKSFTLRGVKHEPDALLKNVSAFNLDALVIQNTPYFGLEIKSTLGSATKLIFWSEHNCDQPAVLSLMDIKIQNSFDAFVFVSNWQKENFLAQFNLDKAKCRVIRNAMSPAFENLFSNTKNILSEFLACSKILDF